jgi:hypothetical protein
MARGGNATLTLDTRKFERMLEVALAKVDRGTKKATQAACEDISRMVMQQVPRDTNALANSFFFEVNGSYKNFTATLGFGGDHAVVNPKSGESTEEYMIRMHEDLEVIHPVGKAKFLEDPVREYQAQFAPRAAAFIRRELGG